jgi:FMN-dependent NADH-azoreductase
MSNVRHVTSSPRGSASYSNQVSHGVIDELQQADPQARVMRQRRALAAAA